MPIAGESGGLWIGSLPDASDAFDGKIDDLRISTAAREFPQAGGCDLQGDLNNDCTVDMNDFALMAENWLISN